MTRYVKFPPPPPLLTDYKQSATVCCSMPHSGRGINGGCSCQWHSFARKDLLRVSEPGGEVLWQPPLPPHLQGVSPGQPFTRG